MKIQELTQKDEKAWDDFVNKSDNSTFFHQIGWRNVVEKTYGHKPIYLFAEEDGEIKGILPIFLIKSWLLGRILVSVPFESYGGICAESSAAKYLLLDEAINIAKNLDANYLELRHYNDIGINLSTNNRYYTLILRLNPDSDILWQNFSKKVRNSTKKAIKSGLTIDRGTDKKYLKEFYTVFSRNIRDLGTPTEGYNFYKNVLYVFPDQTDIFIARKDNLPIGALFLLYFKDIASAGWAASLREYRRLNPNNLLYWKAIKHGCENSYKYFDFGRSLWDSGTFRFKKAWSAEPKQLYYQYYLNKVGDIPDISQASPKRKMFAKVWRRVPIPVVDKLGPMLRRNVP